MNAHDYIVKLDWQLRKLPMDERRAAVAYYAEYLADAGPGGEAAAIAKLGPPAQLAAGIRADAAYEDLESGRIGKKGIGTKGVRATWLSVLGAIPRAALAGLVAGIVVVVVFAALIALFAAGVGVIAGGALGIARGVLGGAAVGWPVLLFYAGCGIVLIVAGSFLIRFVTWVWRHAWHGVARIFNGIRRRRELRDERRAAS